VRRREVGQPGGGQGLHAAPPQATLPAPPTRPRSPPAMRLADRAALLLALALPAACSPAGSDSPASAGATRAAVSAPNGMVVSASAIASAVGRDVLAAGGNAVDAAIATGFALAVTYPAAGNVGGGGFMVIRFPDGRATTIDFREVAPAAATATMFVDSTGLPSPMLAHASHLAVGVPGTVAGFALAHERHGTGEWRRLVDPSVTLAERGFAVPPGLAGELVAVREWLARYPASIAAYYRDGEAYAEGDTLRQPDLARTLARIRDGGRDGFYRGETARLIAAEMRRHGGLITEADLTAYEPREREPVRGSYRGHEIISMAPPSSGGVALVEMLNVLEGYDLKAAGAGSPRAAHLMVEAMRRAFRDRARHLGDPDFARLPVARLTAKPYADSLRATIDTARATPSVLADVAAWPESDQTTHYSVVDASGMAVSVTYTLEGGYGLGAVVEGAGFLLNNEMGDFNQKPGHTDSTGYIGTPANEVRPGKRMLSSMTPTIVARDGELVAVVGSPGGRTIINTVLQVVSNLVDHGMDVQAAVDAPRLHHQWMPDVVRVERAYPTDVVEALRGMGHRVEVGGEQGTAHSILIDPRTRARLGAADLRDRDAGAAGH